MGVKRRKRGSGGKKKVGSERESEPQKGREEEDALEWWQLTAAAGAAALLVAVVILVGQTVVFGTPFPFATPPPPPYQDDVFPLIGSMIRSTDAASIAAHNELDAGAAVRSLRRYVRAAYDAVVRRHQVGYKTGKWQSVEGQQTRWKVMGDANDGFQAWREKTVLDVGCGVGAMYDFVNAETQGAMPWTYVGVDVSGEAIASARRRYGIVSESASDTEREKAFAIRSADIPEGVRPPKFIIADVMDDRFEIEADIVICSGCMTIGDYEQWRLVAPPLILKMWRLAREQLIFNMLPASYRAPFPGYSLYPIAYVHAWAQARLHGARIAVLEDYMDGKDATFVALKAQP